MPVSDQWKAREKGQVEMNSKTSHGEARNPAQTDDQGSSTAEGSGPLSPGRTKDLAGFWANQTDEVKASRKKRLEAVDTPATETVVENIPQRLDGVVRAEDPGEWKKPREMEAGRTRNVASAFQQHQNTSVSQTQRRGDVATDDVQVVRRAKPSVADSTPAKKPAQSPDAVLNRSSATVVLAENDPQQLNPDVVRSSGGSSWDDVTELEAGRTRNLLQHWKSTEEDAAQPKTSTTRYQGGAKPAWILEIEEARATSSGAIGQSEAWAGNTRQQQQQQQQEQETQQETQQEKQQEKQETKEQEKQQEEEIEKSDEAQKNTVEEVNSRDDAAMLSEMLESQSSAVTETLPQQPNDEHVTSPQQPATDVSSPYAHVVQDFRDVSIESSPEQDDEHVTVSRDPQYETAPVSDQPSVCIRPEAAAVDNVDDEMTSPTDDVTESSVPVATEDFEIGEKRTVPTDDVITGQQLVTTDQDRPSAVCDQKLPPTTSSSPSSATATVARQRTTEPVNTASTAVEPGDHGRAKKRHKDDKSKMTEQSAEHHHHHHHHHRRWCSVM